MLKNYVNYIARLSGYELVGEGGRDLNLEGYKLFPRKLPYNINQGAKDPYFHPFTVDIPSITSRLGFSYSQEGWHPFVQTLMEYEDNPTLKYEDSTLARLYRNFCPSNVQEVLLDQIKNPLKPFCDWPAKNELIRWVWALNHKTLQKHLDRLRTGVDNEGWIFFGPHTHEYGIREFHRLINIYESIKRKGFQPGLAKKEPVNGYFLKDGHETRFVLLQGNHRTSALHALGYTEVDVVIRQGHPAIIDKTELHKWTLEGGGIYSGYAAHALFRSLFDESGLEKAIRLNLL